MSIAGVNLVLLGVLGYVVLQLAVGLAVSRRIRTEADYLVAGRGIGLGLATFSMFATWFGAETCIGAAGKFYKEGMSGGVTDPFGYALALFIVGGVFAVPLWRRGLTTLADLFRERFGTGAERFAALIMAPTSVFWAAAQIRAFGQVLSSAGDVPQFAAITIAAGVVILYTCTGGLLADMMTDLIQGIAIIIGLVALLGVLVFSGVVDFRGAWNGIDPARFNLFGGEGPAWAKAELWVLTILGSVVAQELAARVLAAKSPEVARKSAHLGGAIYLVVGLIPAALGLMGPTLLPGLTDGEAFLPELAQKHLPTVLFILFTGALVSAILSTVDSTLLAASSLISHNFIVSFRPAMSDRAKLVAARAGVAGFGVVAYVLALESESIFELVQTANGIGSAGIFVLLVFGLFSGVGGRWSAMGCLGAGTGVWAVLSYAVKDFPAPYLASLVAALAVFLAVAMVESRWRITGGIASASRSGTRN